MCECEEQAEGSLYKVCMASFCPCREGRGAAYGSMLKDLESLQTHQEW